ncbi:MAG: hypothetical protein IJU19_00110 [Bacteroidales bacterium]|nr:hypothetical protein [Bacteroidales bacterium]
MDKKFGKSFVSTLLVATIWLVGLGDAASVRAQSGLYLPTAKSAKDMRKALYASEAFHLLIHYAGSDTTYTVADLDLLDSAYGIAFGIGNPKLYTMTIEGYGGADSLLTQARVDAVYRYFARRSGASFPVRMARNPIRCSCKGDTVETLRFEVPVAKAAYITATLPEARRLLNKTIALDGSVLVTFRNNPDECLGSARGCAVPSADSVVHGYYATLMLCKGSVREVQGTKDTCPSNFWVKVDDHLDYTEVVDRYHMVPHRKQLIVQAGYIVLSSNWKVSADSCVLPQKDSIFVRIPVSAEQLAAKLKFYAKVKGARGVEYKALPTRKTGAKTAPMLQAPINIGQFDTIYIGKRIQENEIKKYFFAVDGPTEAASFQIGEDYYVAYRPDKTGGYELRPMLQALFRPIPVQEEEPKAKKGKKKKASDEEIIED